MIVSWLWFTIYNSIWLFDTFFDDTFNLFILLVIELLVISSLFSSPQSTRLQSSGDCNLSSFQKL